MKRTLGLCGLLWVLGCSHQPPAVTGVKAPANAVAEATSLLGRELVPPALLPSVAADREAKLVAAQAELAERPDDPEAWIWVGRRTAYLGRYREAIEIFTRGIARFPEDARFLRHRGHRYLTVRRFADAESDLARAASMVRGRPDEVEPYYLLRGETERGLEILRRLVASDAWAAFGAIAAEAELARRASLDLSG